MTDEILREFEQEAPVTRRVLERVPLNESDWKPHPKSTAIYGPSADQNPYA